MRKLVEYPTPSLAERDRRWTAVRKEMDARGLHNFSTDFQQLPV